MREWAGEAVVDVSRLVWSDEVADGVAEDGLDWPVMGLKEREGLIA